MAREQSLLVEWIMEEKVGRKKEGGRGGRKLPWELFLFPLHRRERERERGGGNTGVPLGSSKSSTF